MPLSSCGKKKPNPIPMLYKVERRTADKEKHTNTYTQQTHGRTYTSLAFLCRLPQKTTFLCEGLCLGVRKEKLHTVVIALVPKKMTHSPTWAVYVIATDGICKRTP